MNSKQKGARGEREFSSLCREHGYDKARRTVQYAGRVEESADIVGLPGVHVEVKRVERLNIYDAMSQSIVDTQGDKRPIVAHRKNHCDWLITMRAGDWFDLYREWEAGRGEDRFFDHYSKKTIQGA